MKKCSTAENKIQKLMKTLSMQAAIALTFCSLAFAHNNFAQLLDKRVSITLTDVPIEEALEALGHLTNVKFFYSVDQLNIKEKVTLVAVDRPLAQVLDELLGTRGVAYKVHEKKSTITLKKQEGRSQSFLTPPEDAARASLTTSRTQPGVISGTVTDEATLQPMVGVNIIVKGTTEGTTTDTQGKYSVIAENQDILVFSFIGYVTFETQIAGRSLIDVSLREDVQSLKEIVVNAGYFKTTKELQTGSIHRVEAENIQNQPISNPLSALQGRVAGLDITQSTGVSGGNYTVRIRGTNSIGNGNDPLYIIDGVPYTSTSMAFNITSNSLLPDGTSPLNNINPNDIESIEILKDAGATAIYGSRGANGVILITTKKGRAGQERIDVNYYTGVGKVTTKMDLMNTSDYLEMRREAIIADGYQSYLDNPAYDFIWPDVKSWDQTKYTDWQEQLIGGSASITDMQLSLSGGSKDIQYIFGSNLHQEGTVFPGDNTDKRIATHLSLSNTSFGERLHTSLSLNYSVNQTDFIKQDLTLLALTLPPNAPDLYDENGDLNWRPNQWRQTLPNPLAYLETNYESTSRNLLGNLLMNYTLSRGLDLKLSLGYTDVSMNAVTTTPLSYYYPPTRSQHLNESTFGQNHFGNWIVEPQLTWHTEMNQSKFDFLMGTSFLNQESEGLAQFAEGFASEALMKNIGAAPTIALSENRFTKYRYHALYARINFTHADKYIINVTGRRDGSSRFGPGKQFANFGAVGVAWIFSKERAVQDLLSLLSFGKLRGSYGLTGNDQIGDYQYLDTYTTALPYDGSATLRPVRLNNPDFSWETNKKFEMGLDFGFFDDRISLNTTYYRNTSSNQLVGFSLPPTTGFQTIQGNFPAIVRNTGAEVELNTTNIRKTNFEWISSFNFTAPRNELIDFPHLSESPEYANRLVIGQPLSIRKTFRYLGIDPDAGVYTFADVNADGVINTDDRQTIKFVGKQYFGGLQNILRFKGFELNTLFQFVRQSGYKYMFSAWSAPGAPINQPVFVTDRWSQPGDIARHQRYTTTNPGVNQYTNFSQSDEAVGDASFIRLKNISLSYSFQSAVLKKLSLKEAKLFVLSQNLLTVTDYVGMDPETQNINSSLPPLTTVTGGVHITF